MQHFKPTLDQAQWPDWFVTAFATLRGTHNSIYFHYGKLHLCTILHGEREILPTHYVTFDDGDFDLSLTKPVEEPIPELKPDLSSASSFELKPQRKPVRRKKRV